jgi:hypothetical protein
MDLQEVTANLSEYRLQLQQLEELLLMSPENTEYTSLYEELAETIALCEEVLKEAAPVASAAPAQPAFAQAAAPSTSYPSAPGASTSLATVSLLV